VFSCPRERCKDRWDEEGKISACGKVSRGKVNVTFRTMEMVREGRRGGRCRFYYGVQGGG
jgi:hypothetical protein